MTNKTLEYFRDFPFVSPRPVHRAEDYLKQIVDNYCLDHDMALVTKRDWAEMRLLLSKQQSEIEKLLSLLTASPAVIPIPAGYRKVEPPAPSPVAHALDVMDRPRSLRTPIGMEPILPADFDRG
jgi:hypothetical protein